MAPKRSASPAPGKVAAAKASPAAARPPAAKVRAPPTRRRSNLAAHRREKR
jgi:hypothetical protein